MEILRLEPVRAVAGVVQVPGSKSLTNRVVLLAGIAVGVTQVDNVLVADDTSRMLDALAHLGVETRRPPNATSLEIAGVGGPFRVRHADLFLGNAGTAMRPLTAMLTTGAGSFTLRGDPRMHERPIGPLVDALAALGAHIEYLAIAGYPPLRIDAAGLDGGEVHIDGSVSSQFTSALLLAAPLARGRSLIHTVNDPVSLPYVSMTIDVMKRFGIDVQFAGESSYLVEGGQTYRSPGRISIEGDWSSASYFLAAGAIRGGTVRVAGLERNTSQGDVKFLDALRDMGAFTRRGDDWVEVSRGTLHGIDVDARDFPDAAMTLATTALFATGPTSIRGIGNWRIKETDRLAAMATELRKVGATVVEGAGDLHITPPDRLTSAVIDTYGDHRMAMAFSLAALGDVPQVIRNPGVTSKTYPAYFDDFRRISQTR